MKKAVALILALGFSLHVHAQKASSQDSIKVFYKEVFTALRKQFLHKKSVDWKAVELKTDGRLKRHQNFSAALAEIRPLFDEIGAGHCTIYRNREKYSGTPKVIAKTDYSTQWKKKFDEKPGFEVKLLDGKYGYILIPGMVFFDQSEAYIHQLSQPLYDRIDSLKGSTQIDGWLIDLRLNTGGNAAPMLLSLYDFLGDNKIWASLDANKKEVGKFELKKGGYLYNGKQLSHVNPHGELLDTAKVAVLTGVFTASSGEITAIAFKGRPHTVFIGETTYGATTGNVMWPLPFGLTMALTTTYDSDRNGNGVERIVPDLEVLKQDNFDDLLSDEKVRAGIRVLSGM